MAKEIDCTLENYYCYYCCCYYHYYDYLVMLIFDNVPSIDQVQWVILTMFRPVIRTRLFKAATLSKNFNWYPLTTTVSVDIYASQHNR